MGQKKWIGFLLLLCVLSTPSWSANRALIVGVGEYKNSKLNLPGIDVDVQSMKNVALLMGFKESEIRILENEQASQNNIIRSMLTWLVDGVRPEDRVLLYFSGHGTQFKDGNRDEKDDQKDEALVVYEAAIEKVNGQAVAKGFVLDDIMGEGLKKIPSQNLMVFIDACHSGTATRALTLPAQQIGETNAFTKYYDHPYKSLSIDVSTRAAGVRKREEDGARAGYFVLSAAQDSEYAVGLPQGSVFTTGLEKAVRKAVKEKQSLSPSVLQKQIQAHIDRTLPQNKIHHVQLDGDPKKYHEPLPLVTVSSSPSFVPGTRWQNLVAVANEIAAAGGKLPLQSNKTQYRAQKDYVELNIKVPFEGYLNIVSIDTNDDATVLFPNKHHPGNQVQPGSVTIPTAKLPFRLIAQEPLGDTLVVAFFTEEPLNLYEKHIGGERDKDGNYLGTFAGISQAGTRAIGVVGTKSDRKMANSLVVNMVR